MQQSYFGSLETLSDPRHLAVHRSNRSLNSPSLLLKSRYKKKLQTWKRTSSRTKHTSKGAIKVNVSGKCFTISARRLAKYPKSLLSDSEKREKFFDSKKNEYFFDHNRIVAESIHGFYEYGCIDRPENIPEHLFVNELQFFGIYNYIDSEYRDELVVPESEDNFPSDDLWRKKIWMILEKPDSNLSARIYNMFSLSIILFSVFLLCLDTFGEALETSGVSSGRTRTSAIMNRDLYSWVFLSETICIAYFTTELFLRFIVSINKRRFIFNFLNFIDFVAIVPFYIHIFFDIHSIGAPLSVLRVLRLGKIFRVLKISRYSSSLQIIASTVYSGRWDLWMLCFLLLVSCLFFGSLTYYLEKILVLETDSEFKSIPDAMWWALMTSLSVGYGTIVPKSIAGKMTAGICAVSGVIVLAPILPIIFTRWTRYQLLEQQEKLHKKCKLKNANIREAVNSLDFIRVNHASGRQIFLM